MLYVMLHKYKSHRATFDIGPLATLTPIAPPNLELQQLFPFFVNCELLLLIVLKERGNTNFYRRALRTFCRRVVTNGVHTHTLAHTHTDERLALTVIPAAQLTSTSAHAHAQSPTFGLLTKPLWAVAAWAGAYTKGKPHRTGPHHRRTPLDRTLAPPG